MPSGFYPTEVKVIRGLEYKGSNQSTNTLSRNDNDPHNSIHYNRRQCAFTGPAQLHRRAAVLPWIRPALVRGPLRPKVEDNSQGRARPRQVEGHRATFKQPEVLGSLVMSERLTHEPSTKVSSVVNQLAKR